MKPAILIEKKTVGHCYFFDNIYKVEKKEIVTTSFHRLNLISRKIA